MPNMDGTGPSSYGRGLCRNTFCTRRKSFLGLFSFGRRFGRGFGRCGR